MDLGNEKAADQSEKPALGAATERAILAQPEELERLTQTKL